MEDISMLNEELAPTVCTTRSNIKQERTDISRQAHVA